MYSSHRLLFCLIIIGLIGCDSQPPPNSSSTDSTVKTAQKGETKTETKNSSENKTETKTENNTENSSSNTPSNTSSEVKEGNSSTETETKKDPQKNSETKTENSSSDASKKTANTYQEMDVSNGGRLQGKVLFLGEKPKLTVFPITKDNSCCGTEKINHRLNISALNTVKDAIIIIEGIQAGKKWVKQERKLDQKDCAYEPFVQFMEVGKKLKIINSDPILHNVHGYHNEKTVFNIAMPFQNQSLNTKLEDVGICEILCDAGHSWMSSYVYVSAHPYVAISDSEGNFSIDEIPPGEYTVKLWRAGWDIVSTQKDASGIVSAYKYSAPFLLEKTIKIEAGQDASLQFELK